MMSDELTGAEVGLDYSQERIHSGKSYVFTYKTPDASPLGDNEAVSFLVINGAVPIHLIFSGSGNSDLELEFYENTTVSGTGTPTPIVGLNRFRSLPQTPTVYRDPTISSIGDLLYNDFQAWGVETNFTHDAEWVLRPNTNYLVRLTNRAGAVQPVYLLVAWDEPNL